MSPPNQIIVVAAVIEHEEAFLVTRRQAGVHLEGMWEFPGGKTDDAETHVEGLQREIREELDTGVDVHDLILATSHVYPERTVVLYFYRCTLRGSPRPLLGQEMRWVRRDELATLGFPPADRELIVMLTGGAVAGGENEERETLEDTETNQPQSSQRHRDPDQDS